MKLLPTCGDILRACLHLRVVGATVKNPKLKNFGSVVDTLAESLIKCWEKASIPQLKSKVTKFVRKLKKLNEAYVKVRKAVQSGNNAPLVNLFKKEVTSLFEICACSCPITEKLFRGKMHCTCPEEMLVLGAEVKFLVDQRSPRLLKIPRR